MIVVTGGSGFIGERVVRRLAADGERVVSADVRPPEEEPEGWTFRQTDLLDPQAVLTLLEELAGDGTEVVDVVHLAGPVVEMVRKSPGKAVELQVQGTVNLLEAVRKVGRTRRVVAASSFYVYAGMDPELAVSERTPIDLLSGETFSGLKLLTERLLRQYAQGDAFEWCALRFGSVYGFGRCSNVVQEILLAGLHEQPFTIWGRGKRTNQYTFVEDVVDGVMLALRDGWTGPMNLVSPELTTTGQLAEVFRRQYGFEIAFEEERPEGASMPYMVSQKALAAGWTPTPLVEGLALTYAEAKDAGA